ncbi:hypothetical protein ABOM_001791 [Aspergillus bombycis]|uniref:Methyltransferase domain-containing protein n=1 Tax=Aspergillus bombycis TaxID=109264 RepID=A0A1F8AD80_9EURO|nr:hypothetical protein ABOM_001791 [Aspergillus bombycis]OGM49683.1 hypothetical protein ABOM_001791 [Aspergillus bombycis]
MKIGILILRGDAVEGPCVVNPSRYLSRTRHQLEILYISKSKAEAEIDKVSNDGYGMFLNHMVAESDDDVLRVAAITRYLEAKDITFLNRPYLLYSSDTREESRCLRIPVQAHELSPEHLKGQKWICLAMEMGREALVFTPSQCATSVCHDREDLHTGPADFTWIREDPLQSMLKSITLDMLKVSSGGFVRVEVLPKAEFGRIYLEGLVRTPRAFHGGRYTTYEDVVICEEFPGGHMALLDMLITSKQIRSGQDSDRNQHLAGVYDSFAPRYPSARANTGLSRMQEDLSRDYDFSGTVLDLACGNGEFGATLHELGVSAKITGIDVSEGMTRSSYIQDHYEKPILIGPMDELIMASSLGMPEFDHVVCFAAFQFLDPVHLTACLARMFMVAQRSVTAIHEDLSEAYIENMKQQNGALCSNFNHTSTLAEFGVPKGWKQVLMERFPLYDHPTLGEAVDGLAVRFERA